MSSTPIVTDWITAVSTAGSFLAVAITAAIAIRTLNAAKADSQIRSRPVMYAQFVPTPLGVRHVDLEIGNAGQGIARDVRVVFDPPELVLPDDSREPALANLIKRRYERPIAQWVPGVRFRSGYFVGDHGERRKNLEPLPDNLTVTIRYKDDLDRPYEDRFSLDMEPVLQETKVTNRKKDKLDSEQPWPRYVTEALEAIARSMR